MSGTVESNEVKLRVPFCKTQKQFLHARLIWCIDKMLDKILMCIGQILKKKERKRDAKYYSHFYTEPHLIVQPFHFANTQEVSNGFPRALGTGFLWTSHKRTTLIFKVWWNFFVFKKAVVSQWDESYWTLFIEFLSLLSFSQKRKTNTDSKYVC